MNKASKFVDGEIAIKLFQSCFENLVKMFKSKEEDIKARNEKLSEE